VNSETVWGAAFFVYILLGIYPMLKSETGPRPKNTIPGSEKLKRWEKSDKAGQRGLMAWCAGFAVLMGAWYLAG